MNFIDMPCAIPQFASIASINSGAGSAQRASTVWPRVTTRAFPTLSTVSFSPFVSEAEPWRSASNERDLVVGRREKRLLSPA